MIKKILFHFSPVMLVFLWSGSVFSQDSGIPDTARVECLGKVRPNSQVVLNVYVINDENLGGFSIPLVFPDTVTGLDITCDSISFVGTRAESAGEKSDSASIDNAKNRLVVTGIWYSGNLAPGNGSVAKIYFRTGPGWDSTQYVPVDSTQWPTEVPTMPVTLEFTDPLGFGFVPAFVKGCLGAGIVTANFSANPRAGYKPLSVQFSDLSTGEPLSWNWNFGDGGASTEKNPLHVYNNSGQFDVRLIISRLLSSDTVVKTQYIKSYDTLTVDFSGGPTEGRPPLTVKFRSLCNSTPDNATWYFGDGQTSNNPDTVSHEYANYGSYSVKLVAGLFGYQDSLTRLDYISVKDSLSVTAYSPVDLIVTAPNLDSIGIDFNTIGPGAVYISTVDYDSDGVADDRVLIHDPMLGEYKVKVKAESDTSTGNYSLAIKLDGNEDHVVVTSAPVPPPGQVDTFSYEVIEYLRGDPTKDNKRNVGDVIYLINYMFKGGPPPDPFYLGDVNCDDLLRVGDVIYLINYLFKNGPAPCS